MIFLQSTPELMYHSTSHGQAIGCILHSPKYPKVFTCPTMKILHSSEQLMQCGAVITRLMFLKNFTIDTPYFSLMGEIWGVCCNFKLWFTFCHCYRSAIAWQIGQIYNALDIICTATLWKFTCPNGSFACNKPSGCEISHINSTFIINVLYAMCYTELCEIQSQIITVTS